MIINDLNYLEVTNEEVVGGYYGSSANANKNVNLNTDVDQDFDVDVDIDIDKNVDIDFNSNVDASGNAGSLTFDATAIGDNGFAEADVSLIVTGNLVEASGTLTAGVD